MPTELVIVSGELLGGGSGPSRTLGAAPWGIRRRCVVVVWMGRRIEASHVEGP
ncbi:MAG: hypothetical protein ACLPV8_13420 [Steroidobacteraceae bacterium]